MTQKDKINRGDDATAFGKSPIKIILEYDSPYQITRADFVVNGGVLVKKYMNPVFPLEVILDSKDTAKLEYKNIGKLVVWDERGRRETTVGALFFCTDPDVYDTGKYSVTPEDLNCKCTCHDGVYHAIFTINATPERVSELINDLEFQTRQEVADSIQAESDIINARIDEIEVDLDNTITNIIGDDLIDVDVNNRLAILKSKTFVFEQALASSTWTIVHNLNKHPSVFAVDTSGKVQIPDEIVYDSNTQVTVKFIGMFAGYAYLN